MGELKPARKTLTQAAEEAAAQHSKVELGVKFLKRRADLTREALEASEQADEQEAELARMAKAHPVETRLGAAVTQMGLSEVLKVLEKFGNDYGSRSVSKKNFRVAMGKIGMQVGPAGARLEGRRETEGQRSPRFTLPATTLSPAPPPYTTTPPYIARQPDTARPP